MWGDRFQVVVSTHLNTQHLHNHFVINSVSFKDGKKYYSNLTNTALLRKTSDEICEEYGLKVLEEKPCKSGVNFENFYKKSIRDSDYYEFAKEDIDYAIKSSYSVRQFQQMLSSMGYEYYYRSGKLSVRREPYKRNIRVERAFGEEYTIDRIRKKILDSYPKYKAEPLYKVYKTSNRYKGSVKNKNKATGIKALYLYYCYLLKIFPKKNIKHKLSPEMRKEVKKMEMYSQENKFLCKYNISMKEDLDSCKCKLNDN